MEDPFLQYMVPDDKRYAASTSSARPIVSTSAPRPTLSTSAPRSTQSESAPRPTTSTSAACSIPSASAVKTTADPPTAPTDKSPMNVRKVVQSKGLNKQLPSSHPLVTMLRNTLKMSHGETSCASDNYVANVSRILYHVQHRLIENGTPPTHWADLISNDVSHYKDYITQRESLGQTKATTINYLKNIRLLFGNVLKCYVHDGSFPKGFDLLPCQETITNIKLLEHKLDLLYKRTTKQQPQVLFQRKTNEATSIPDYADVVASLEKMYLTIKEN